MKFLKAVFPALVLALVAACSSVQVAEQNTVYSAGAAYLAADTLANRYMHLPVCVQGGSPVCAVPAVVSKILSIENQVYTDYQIAEKTVRSGGTPNSSALSVAVSQLSTLVTQLKIN